MAEKICNLTKIGGGTIGQPSLLFNTTNNTEQTYTIPSMSKYKYLLFVIYSTSSKTNGVLVATSLVPMDIFKNSAVGAQVRWNDSGVNLVGRAAYRSDTSINANTSSAQLFEIYGI